MCTNNVFYIIKNHQKIFIYFRKMSHILFLIWIIKVGKNAKTKIFTNSIISKSSIINIVFNGGIVKTPSSKITPIANAPIIHLFVPNFIFTIDKSLLQLNP